MADLLDEAIEDLYKRKGRNVRVIDESDPTLTGRDRDTLMAARTMRSALLVNRSAYANRMDLEKAKEG